MSIDVSFRDLWHWIGYWKNQSQQLWIWEWRCQRVLDQPCKAIWLRTYSLFMKPLSFLLPRVSKLALQPLSARSLPWWWPWSKPSGDLTKAELMGPSDTLPTLCTLGEKNEEDTLDGTHPPVCLSWRLRVPGELRMEMWSRCCFLLHLLQLGWTQLRDLWIQPSPGPPSLHPHLLQGIQLLFGIFIPIIS